MTFACSEVTGHDQTLFPHRHIVLLTKCIIFSNLYKIIIASVLKDRRDRLAHCLTHGDVERLDSVTAWPIRERRAEVMVGLASVVVDTPVNHATHRLHRLHAQAKVQVL